MSLIPYPSYISSEIAKHLDRSRLCRLWGHLNIYTCEKCRAQLVTTDLDEGTTPFTTTCHECGAFSVSGMYRVSPSQKVRPTHAWYRPETTKGVNRGTREHLEQGGLILRKLTDEERLALAS